MWIGRYVFDLSTKHPVVSAHEYIQGKLFCPHSRVEKMPLMSHKISMFQLISIVKILICAAMRSAAFLRGSRAAKFCQKRSKTLDINPIFSTRARGLKPSAEEPPQEILDGKSIARATSMLVNYCMSFFRENYCKVLHQVNTVFYTYQHLAHVTTFYVLERSYFCR